MKRVLFVDQSEVLGGAELSLIDIASRFDDCTVAVFSEGEFSRRLAELKIDVANLDVASSLKDVKRSGGRAGELAALPGLVGASFRLARLAKGYDTIYANTQKAMLVAGIAGKLSRRPVIWHLRDLMTTDHFSDKLIRVSIAAANRMVTQVIANSKATATSFTNAGGDASRVSVVHNGIDPEPFESIDQSDKNTIRRELGIGSARLAGVFSRIAEWKGQDVAINAASMLGDWHVAIVGDALFQNDEEYKDRLKHQVQQNQMEERVHFLGFRTDVPALMAACDVVIHASTSPEPFGRVIVEGMLARTPVIAAQGGGASEIVRHGVNGFLFNPAKPEELRDLLAQLSDGSQSTILESAYEEATTYYSVDRLVKEVRQVVDSTQ